MRYLLLIITLFFTACSTIPADRQPRELQLQQPSLQRLSNRDIATVKAMLVRLEPFIEARKKAGDQALVTFEELYRQLTPEESRLVSYVQNLKPEQIGVRTPWIGYGDPATKMVPLVERYRRTDGVLISIPTQYLPVAVHDRYLAMMAAMQADLGKRLYISSGHRSGAYQLYLYFLYLQKHDWSLQETGRFVALPGYSEHGATQRQAVDFVSAGASMDDGNEKFEELAEYAWLQQHAQRYGFVLSYPRGSTAGIAFEPWHWHYDPDAAGSALRPSP